MISLFKGQCVITWSDIFKPHFTLKHAFIIQRNRCLLQIVIFLCFRIPIPTRRSQQSHLKLFIVYRTNSRFNHSPELNSIGSFIYTSIQRNIFPICIHRTRPTCKRIPRIKCPNHHTGITALYLQVFSFYSTIYLCWRKKLICCKYSNSIFIRSSKQFSCSILNRSTSFRLLG